MGEDHGVTDVPSTGDLEELRGAAAHCVRCELHAIGTQTVFGEGPARAWLMFIGEQPGDQEDKQGRPFVGPAGRVLQQALDELGIDRGEVYVTNAVKHFRWEPRGKRRIHKTPTVEHVRACGPWLAAEVRAVQPAVLGILGAVAARAVLGASFRLTENRGREVPSPFRVPAIATVHPSSVLRADDRHDAYRAFLADLHPLLALRRSR